MENDIKIEKMKKSPNIDANNNDEFNVDQESPKERKTGAAFKEGKEMPINHVHLKSFAMRSVNMKKREKKKVEVAGYSLFVFGPDNCLRLGLKALIENEHFENFIYHMIALNSLYLSIDSPSLEDPYQKNSLGILLTTISIVFILECVIKVIVMGFYWGENTYLKDNWNVLDFVIVGFSILTWILESLSGFDISFVRGFRALRALRPLRMVSKNEGIKTVVNSLLLSIPSLLNVMLIILLFLLVFGILGVQFWKGAIAWCTNDDPSIENK